MFKESPGCMFMTWRSCHRSSRHAVRGSTKKYGLPGRRQCCIHPGTSASPPRDFRLAVRSVLFEERLTPLPARWCRSHSRCGFSELRRHDGSCGAASSPEQTRVRRLYRLRLCAVLRLPSRSFAVRSITVRQPAVVSATH